MFVTSSKEGHLFRSSNCYRISCYVTCTSFSIKFLSCWILFRNGLDSVEKKKNKFEWFAITKISRDELGPFLHGCLHFVSFICLFVYLHVFFLLPLLLISLLLSLLFLFCWRFVVIALISVLRIDYKIGHRKSFWYSPFLIHDYDYDSTTDEMYSLRSCSIGINRFWLVCLSFFAFYWLGEDRSRLLNQLFQVASR